MISRKKDSIYSRYIDDISISSKSGFSKEDKYYVVGKVYAMMFSNGFKPKRRKHQIQNRKSSISVHNLNLISEKPTLPKKERGKIRAAVFQLRK